MRKAMFGVDIYSQWKSTTKVKNHLASCKYKIEKKSPKKSVKLSGD